MRNKFVLWFNKRYCYDKNKQTKGNVILCTIYLVLGIIYHVLVSYSFITQNDENNSLIISLLLNLIPVMFTLLEAYVTHLDELDYLKENMREKQYNVNPINIVNYISLILAILSIICIIFFATMSTTNSHMGIIVALICLSFIDVVYSLFSFASSIFKIHLVL